ncbi:MAG: tripartite tricarboxylate transporter substrate binding protein [Pseudomonadota bacterium]|nr:tripartite tricarboxylate transporter substrate binding protein [Pseudomonadota bacterium]
MRFISLPAENHPGSASRPLSRRRAFALAIALGAGIALLTPLAARAQADWPQKPIRLVVPYAPGGSADTLGRLIAKHLGEAFKQTVVVDNKAGAGGLIGSEMVAKAPPDGYTLLVSGIGSHVIAPVESPQHYDPMKDFTHIAMLAGPPLALVVNAEQPYKDFKSFVRHVAADPNGLSWGSPGQGTHGYLTGELFRAATKLKMVHISYKGAGPAVADLVANQIPAAFMTLSSANAHVQSGKLRLLALTSAKRLPEYPNVPTLAELGYPALTGITWFALSGPAKMPSALVDKINAEVRRGMKTPAITAQLKLESMETADMDAAAFTRFVAAEIERWGPAARSVTKAAK